MAISKKLRKPQAWLQTFKQPMATYENSNPPSLAELELRYFNLASACHMRDEELTATRARRDAAFIAWRDAGGYK